MSLLMVQERMIVRVIAQRWGAEAAPTAVIRLAGAKECLLYASLLIYEGFYRGERPSHLTQALLANAELTAREFAHAAEQYVGYIPLTARLSFMLAKGHAGEGDTARALEMYWRAGIEAHQVMWLRTAAAPKSSPGGDS